MTGTLEAVGAFFSNLLPFSVHLVIANWQMFFDGFRNTIALLIGSLVIGGVLAVPLAIVRAARVPVLNPLAYGYIYLIRGTPLLVQLYVIYYGLSQFDAVRDSAAWVVLREPWWCALISFSIGTSAYTAEILRGAIEDTPRGEVEAATSAGMSRLLILRRILLPSAFRRALPAYGNEVIFTLHTTVLASTVTVIDLLGAARAFNNKYYLGYEGFITAALIFIVIVFVITRIFRLLERSMLRHLKVA